MIINQGNLVKDKKDMKKIILLLISGLLLTGCSNTGNSPNVNHGETGGNNIADTYDDGVVKPVLNFQEINEILPDDVTNEINEKIGYVDAVPFLTIGTDVSNNSFEALDGSTISLSELKGKKVIINIVATWCDNSKNWIKNMMDKTIEKYEDAEFIQIFTDFGNEQHSLIEEFYKNIQKEPDTSKIIPPNGNVKSFLNRLGISSYPTFLFIDEEGKLNWSALGFLEDSVFETHYEFAYGDNAIIKRITPEILSDIQRDVEDVKADLTTKTVNAIGSLKGAIDQETYDLSVYTDLGKKVVINSLTDTKGKPVSWSDVIKSKTLISFMGNIEDESLYSNHNAKVLKEIAEKHPDYTFINILFSFSNDESVSVSDETLSMLPGRTYRTTDPDMPYELFGISFASIPSLYMINEESRIAGVCPGKLTLEHYEKLEETFFGETPVYRNLK